MAIVWDLIDDDTRVALCELQWNRYKQQLVGPGMQLSTRGKVGESSAECEVQMRQAPEHQARAV